MQNDKGKEDKFQYFDIEPWEQEIDSVKLYELLHSTITKFIVANDEEIQAITLWVIHTYFIRQISELQPFTHSPILHITSPERGCGKSTLREVLEQLTPRNLSLMNGSTSTIFRLIQKRLPTLFIDEADTFIENRTELIGVLNSGYTKHGKVFRQGGKQFEDTLEFSTWCAKSIIGIGNLPETLQSRCIKICLKRKMSSDTISRINEELEDNPDLFINVKRQLIRFAIDQESKLLSITVTNNPKLDDRSQDNWRPLLKLAKLLSEDIFDSIVKVSEILAPINHQETSQGVELLGDIKILVDYHSEEKISTQGILLHLMSMDDRPWKNYQRKGLTAYDLSVLLKPYGIKPIQFKLNEKVLRGYEVASFTDAFNRYLS
jgi:hypothetical protein